MFTELIPTELEEYGSLKQCADLPDEIKVSPELFEHLWNLHPTEKGHGIINGKPVQFHRYQQSYGKSYFFTGEIHTAKKIEEPYLLKLLEWVNENESTSTSFNQILINWYEDGSDYIGEHSDDERQLVKNSNIYSFSFGQEREFIIKRKKHSSFPSSIPENYRQVIFMRDNSLLIMGGKLQTYFTHQVPKRTTKKCAEKRINITVRCFK